MQDSFKDFSFGETSRRKVLSSAPPILRTKRFSFLHFFCFILFFMFFFAHISFVSASDLKGPLNDSIRKDYDRVIFEENILSKPLLEKDLFVTSQVISLKNSETYNLKDEKTVSREISVYDNKTGEYKTEVFIERKPVAYITFTGGIEGEYYALWKTDFYSEDREEILRVGYRLPGSKKFLNGEVTFPVYSFSSHTIDLTDGLVSYWKFDETSGTNAEDSVGSNDGAANNVRVFTTEATGVINTGADFTAGNDNIMVTHTSALGLTGDAHTISLWVYFDDFPTGSKRIINKDTGNDNAGGYSFYLDSGDKLAWYIGTGTSRNWQTSFVPNVSTWYHVVAVFEKDVQRKIYINSGTPYTSTNHAFSLVNRATPDNLYFGMMPVHNQAIDGYLDEVGIYDRALNEDEVIALYNDGDGFQYPFIMEVVNVTFSNITSSNISNESASINFDLLTSHEVNVSVEYWYNNDYNGTMLETTPFNTSINNSYQVNLTGLLSNTSYIYRVKADYNSQLFYSGNETFNTTTTIIPPDLTQISVLNFFLITIIGLIIYTTGRIYQDFTSLTLGGLLLFLTGFTTILTNLSGIEPLYSSIIGIILFGFGGYIWITTGLEYLERGGK